MVPFPAFQQQLEDIAREGPLRHVRSLERCDAREMVVDGRTFLHASTNDYLGLSTHPRVVEAAVKATRDHGAGGRASRLISGNNTCYDELEAELAEYKGTESALVLSTGYHANLALVPLLAPEGSNLFVDRLSHACLVDGARLAGGRLCVYPHGDAGALREMVRRRGKASVIVTDGVFSMDGDIAPLPELLEVAEEADCRVLVDDAHATGVLGPEGRGTAHHFGLDSERIVQMGTLSKALGSLGGFVAAPAALRELLVNKGRTLIYTTALPPGTVAAAAEAVRVAREAEPERQHLQEMVALLAHLLRERGWDVADQITPVLPLRVGSVDEGLERLERMQQQGVYVPLIRPPTVPRDGVRFRISLSALHSEEDVGRIAEAIGKR